MKLQLDVLILNQIIMLMPAARKEEQQLMK